MQSSPPRLLRRTAHALPLLVALACGGRSMGPDPNDTSDAEDLPVGRITPTHLPIDVAGVLGMHQLGNLNVLPEDHGGFYLPRERRYSEPTMPIAAPADGRIIAIIRDWYPFLGFGASARVYVR